VASRQIQRQTNLDNGRGIGRGHGNDLDGSVYLRGRPWEAVFAEALKIGRGVLGCCRRHCHHCSTPEWTQGETLEELVDPDETARTWWWIMDLFGSSRVGLKACSIQGIVSVSCIWV
jgi:hypothetical protein